MPRTIKADGRTITVPDDATPEEINEIVGPAPKTDAPPSPTGDWRDPLTRIDPHQPVHSVGDVLKEGLRGVGNIGAGGLGVLLRPVETAKGIGKFLSNPIHGAKEMTDQFITPEGGLAPNALENAESFLGQAAVMGGAGEAAGKVIPKAAALPGKILRVGQEAVTKTSPSDVANIVRDTSAKNAEEVAKAAEADKKAAAEHLDKTQSALHETRGREIEHEQKVKAAKEEAEGKRKLDLKKHLDTRNEAVRQRQESEAKVTAEKLKQGKISPTQAKLENAWSNLRAGVETAREKALGVGNAKYSGVNEALSHVQSDPEFFPSAVANATEALRGSKAEPTLLKAMEKNIQEGNVASYADLQGDYSALGKEISKGSLPGDVFHAYDQLHEAIGEEMQRIADAEGKGAELRDARNYWRRMKQTFGKPFNPTDTATSATEKAAPSVASAEEQANRIRLLGSFDERLPGMFEHVENIRKGVESLPDPKSARQIEQGSKAPAIPPRKPFLPKVEPKPVAPPERVAPPDRPQPTPAKTTTLTPQTLSDMKGANVDKGSADFRAPNKLATTFLGYDLMRHAFNALGNAADFKFGTAARDVLGAARDVGIRVGYAMGSGKMADLLERPAVRDSLSKITERDIAELRKLPPDQQAALGTELKALVDAAPAKGVKVSAPLAAWVGAVAGAQATRKRPGDILKPK